MKDEMKAKELVKEMAPKQPEPDIEDMPLETMADYIKYNKRARELNKKLRMCRYPIKPVPVELHPHDRIVFGRNDQPSNPLKVFLSNDMIEFKKTLIPGETYDLPRIVIDHIANKGVPVWKWFNNPDGSKETRISHKNPRFALRTVYPS